VGAGWCLAGELGSALADDLLDDRNGVATFVIAEQPLEQVGVRIGAHDSNCGPIASAVGRAARPGSARGNTSPTGLLAESTEQGSCRGSPSGTAARPLLEDWDRLVEFEAEWESNELI